MLDKAIAVFLKLLPACHFCLDAMVHPHMHQQLGTEWNWDGETNHQSQRLPLPNTVLFLLGCIPNSSTGPSCFERADYEATDESH